MPHVFDAIRASLPMAFGIAASPSPVVAILILLMTRRATSNALFFLTGWFTGLLLVELPTFYRSGIIFGFSEGSFINGWSRNQPGAHR
jgi:hypothetical protein